MKRIIVFLLAFVLGSSAFAQTLGDIKNSNELSINGLAKELISVRNSVFGDTYE